MSPSCGACRFYHPNVTTGSVTYAQNSAGECRINPPSIFAYEYAGFEPASRVWPIVYSKDWCGLFSGLEIAH